MGGRWGLGRIGLGDNRARWGLLMGFDHRRGRRCSGDCEVGWGLDWWDVGNDWVTKVEEQLEASQGHVVRESVVWSVL